MQQKDFFRLILSRTVQKTFCHVKSHMKSNSDYRSNDMKKESFLKKYILLIISFFLLFCLSYHTVINAEEIPPEVPSEPENGIPLLIINIDEAELHEDESGNSYGTIQDMNESENHSVRCHGSITVKIPEGYTYEYGESELTFDEESGDLLLSYIRGRGNSTWFSEKKPYKIKFDQKQNLFGMGSAKEWALLANASDPTLMKNRLVSWLGNQMEQNYCPEMVPVDVVMTGSGGSTVYLGSYCLSELAETGENRLNTAKLKSDMAEENEITGGYLISFFIEDQSKNKPENSVFTTDSGLRFLIDEPEYPGNDGSNLTEAQQKQLEYISDYIQQLENLILLPETIDEEQHAEISEMMDLTSLADYWLIQEFTINGDAFTTSSTYFHKDRDGKLVWGPLWDFDLALGSQDAAQTNENTEVRTKGFYHSRMSWIDALREKDPQFVSLIKDRWQLMNTYITEITESGGVIDRYTQEVIRSAEADRNLGLIESEFPDGLDDYEITVEKLRNWITRRQTWFSSHIDLLGAINTSAVFNADGKTVETRTVRIGDCIFDPPQAPVKEGFYFKGWYTADTHESCEFTTIAEETVFNAEYISEKDAVNPQAICFPLHEAWISGDETMFTLNSCPRLLPEDVTISSISWASSDEDIGNVDELGFVMLHKPGDITVTASHVSGLSASYTLHILADDSSFTSVTGIHPEQENITVTEGEEVQLQWHPEPEDTPVLIKQITFSSDDEETVSVDECGVIKGLKPGTASLTIEASSDNEFADDQKWQSASVQVTVTAPQNNDNKGILLCAGVILAAAAAYFVIHRRKTGKQ